MQRLKPLLILLTLFVIVVSFTSLVIYGDLFSQRDDLLELVYVNQTQEQQLDLSIEIDDAVQQQICNMNPVICVGEVMLIRSSVSDSQEYDFIIRGASGVFKYRAPANQTDRLYFYSDITDPEDISSYITEALAKRFAVKDGDEDRYRDIISEGISIQ